MRLFLFLILATFSCLAQPQFISSAQGQSPATNWRVARMELEQQFGDDLQEIAQWCREHKIDQQIETTLANVHERDLGRQYIFMPSEQSMPSGGEEILGQWVNRLNAAKIAHAERILKLAGTASQQGDGAVAFQLLHEVIFYNRDHIAVRKMLGHRKSEKGWKVASDSVRVKPGSRHHDVVNWPAKTYIRVLTPHFEIESNADEQRTQYLAEQLERAHLVWRQVFFEYWSSPSAVKRWIDGNGGIRMPSKRFRVVFFKDRASYLGELQPIIPGVQVSTGYYSSDQEVSFFYDGDERVQDTWRHELTHQLFRESGRANRQPFEHEFIWLDEGIATYFESMTDFDAYVTLGGFESRRVQYARIYRLLENFYVPLAELSAIGRADLQQRTDMVRLYSEVAGLTDMLMNAENGAYEQRLTEFLKLIYKGRVKKGAFAKIIGQTYLQLDERYLAHLKVDSRLVEQHLTRPESRTELSLASANLTTKAFDSIGKCINLNWLDLSRNKIGAEDLTKLKSCTRLNQLILTNCEFERESLRALNLFPLLDDLDLSGSQLQDIQLANFSELQNLKSLRLGSTGITDQGLMQLANVQTLRSLDVSNTKVTAQGIAKLKSYIPKLQVTK